MPAMNNYDLKMEESDHDNIDQSYKLLLLLQSAINDEGAAIENMDIRALSEAGTEIDRVINILGRHLPDRVKLSDCPFKDLLFILRDIRLKREANHNLLKDAGGRTGNEVKRLSLGRRALKSYYLTEGSEELYLRKKC
jgi:hypothetical protein